MDALEMARLILACKETDLAQALALVIASLHEELKRREKSPCA